MSTCRRCGKVNVDFATYCAQCGRRLPRGSDPPVATATAPERAQLEFLLAEMTSWVDQGLVSAEVAVVLALPYHRQLEELNRKQSAATLLAQALRDERSGRLDEAQPTLERVLQLMPTNLDARSALDRVVRERDRRAQREAAAARTAVAQPTAPAPAAAPPPPPPPAPSWSDTVEAFLQERNIFWWQIVSALLLVSGMIGLAWWQWNLLGRYLVTTLLSGITLGVYQVGRATIEKLPANGRVLIVVALTLAPVNLVVINSYRVLGAQLPWDSFGLLAALTAGALYVAMLRRWKFESIAYLACAAGVCGTHYALRLGGISQEDEGLGFVLMALGMLFAARRTQDHALPLSRPLLNTAQGVVVLSLAATALAPASFYAAGHTARGAAMFALTATFTAAFAELFRQSRAVYAASAFVGLAAVIGMLGWSTSLLESFPLTGLIVAIVLTAIAEGYQRRHEDQAFASGYRLCGWIAGGFVALALLAQGGALVAGRGLPNDTRELAHLAFTSAVAAMFYAGTAKLHRRPHFAHLALAATAYTWLIASRLVTVSLARSPLNAGLALYPLTLLIAIYGARQIRRRNAANAFIALPWAAGLSAVSLSVQLFAEGLSAEVVAARATQLLNFLQFGAPGTVSSITVVLLHAALFGSFAQGFGAMRWTDDERESPLRQVARGAAPWLSLATMVCLAVAAIQLLAQHHVPLSQGALTMMLMAAGLLITVMVTERTGMPWWSRPAFVTAVAIALMFVVIPFTSVAASEVWALAVTMSLAVLLLTAAARTLPGAIEEETREFPPGGNWLRVDPTAQAMLDWMPVAAGAMFTAMFLLTPVLFELSLGSWPLAVYFVMCAVCWHRLAWVRSDSALFVAALIAGAAAVFQSVCAALPPATTSLGWHGLASAVYALALMACAGLLRRCERTAFAGATETTGHLAALTGVVLALVRYHAVTKFALPIAGGPDLHGIDRWLLVACGLLGAAAFGVTIRTTQSLEVLRASWLVVASKLTVSYFALLEFPFAMPVLLGHLDGEANFGLAFVPLALLGLLTAGGFASRDDERSQAARGVIGLFASVVALACAGAQVYYIYEMAFALTPVVTLLTLAGAAAIGSAMAREARLVPIASALLGWGLAQWMSNAGYDAAQIAILFALCAAAAWAGAELFRTDSEAGKPWRAAFAQTSVAFACAANLFAVAPAATSLEAGTAASLLATLLVASRAVRCGRRAYAELGAASLLILCLARDLNIAFRWMGLATAWPVIETLPAIAGAFAWLAVGFLMSEARLVKWSAATLLLGLLPAGEEPLLVFAVVALCGLGYGLFAHRTESSQFGALGAICVAIANWFGLQGSPAPSLYHPLLFAPLVVALSLWPEEMPHLMRPFRATAGVIAGLAVFAGVTGGDRWVAFGVLALYGALVLIDAVRKRSETEAVFAGALLSAAWMHLAHTQTTSPLEWVVAVSPLSLVWLGVAELLGRDEPRAPVTRVIDAYSVIAAAGVAVASLLTVSGDRAHGTLAVFALLISALTFGLLSARLRQSVFAHASFFCVLMSYYLPLYDAGIQAADAYLIPIGLYMIALSLLYERTNSDGDQRDRGGVLADLGLLIALGSSLWSSCTIAGNPWHDVVLTTEALAAFAFGLTQRRRTFAFQGAGFLLALGVIKAWGILVSIHWAIYATTLGLAGLALGYYLSLKRDEVMALTDRVRSELSGWR